MNTIDAKKLFANETPDISDTWASVSDYGWTQLDPGLIAAFRWHGEWKVGFVTAKHEEFGERRVSFCAHFVTDYKEQILTADINDVFVPRALTAIYRGSAIPEAVCLERFKPDDLTVLARPVSNPDHWMIPCIGDISILYPDGTALPIGYADTKGDAEFPPIKVSRVLLKTYSDCGRLKAMVKVELNNLFCLNGLHVVESDLGLYVRYPENPFYQYEDYQALFYPIDAELRRHIEDSVLEEYHKATEA